MPESTASSVSERRGGYRPEQPIATAPPFRWPPQPMAVFKWLFGFPGYFWPWQALFLGLSVLLWLFLTPDMDTMKSFSVTWIALIFLRNLALLVLFVGLWHARLYVQKSQVIQYKYNSKWLSTDDPTFLFRDQLWDNVFWNVASAVPIWTAYEALTLWLHANELVPSVSWQAHPIYCMVLFLLALPWLAIHFYATHRLIHWPPLYRSIHYLHHKNVNVGPWSGLAMHPLEHLILFSVVVLCWVIPSHPVLSVYLLVHTALGATLSHLGFDRVVLNKRISLNFNHYFHYLHHKYVRVNYGAGIVPLDKWFGTFHDGSDAAQEAFARRLRAAAKARASRHIGPDDTA